MLPAIPAIGTLLAGGVVAGITQFLLSRAGMILSAMGLTFIATKGLEVFMGYAVSDISTIVAALNSMGGGSGATSDLGAKMLQFAAYAGLFDAVNIVISGFMSVASLVGVRFLVARFGSTQ